MIPEFLPMPSATASNRSFIPLTLLLLMASISSVFAQASTFKVIAFYTAKNDLAHISFVHQANQWFPEMARQHHFTYDSTNDWNNLNEKFLSNYQVVVFLDTRPETPAQREALQAYIEKGNGWLGFHFAAFALTPSTFPQNWNWYHESLLGAGEYKSNTWRPTSAVLQVEDREHPVVKNLPATITAAPNEWYRWKNDLRKNPDIKVLLSIHPSSFPLGTGPKQHEIWHEGDYPVVWANTKYKVVYMNMGHNDMDYEGKTNRTLSDSFSSEMQNKLILNSLFWLAGKTQ
jgi:uncharacterized protein